MAHRRLPVHAHQVPPPLAARQGCPSAHTRTPGALDSWSCRIFVTTYRRARRRRRRQRRRRALSVVSDSGAASPLSSLSISLSFQSRRLSRSMPSGGSVRGCSCHSIAPRAGSGRSAGFPIAFPVVLRRFPCVLRRFPCCTALLPLLHCVAAPDLLGSIPGLVRHSPWAGTSLPYVYCVLQQSCSPCVY